MRPSNPLMIPWSHLSNVLLLFIPLLISAKWPILRIHSFTPKQIIYSNNLIPLLLAPWSWPTTVRATLSRLIQATLLVKVSNDIRTPIKCYALTLLIGLLRTLTGFLLSRSVGWAYPKFFNHYALYETISGFGPALLVYLSLTGHAKSWAEYLTSRWSVKYSLEDRGSVFIALLSMLLSWLDDAPWTYTMAPICTLSLVLLRAILWRLACTRYHPMALDPPEKSQPTVRMRAIMQTILLSLLVIPQPSLLDTLLYPIPKHLSLPPRARSPLLEILILSHPRPTDIDLLNITYSTTHTATSTQIHKPMPSSILYSTICSYLSFLPSETDSSTRLSVFTHTLPHPAFTHAQQYFSPTSSPQHTNIPLEFYVDTDTHPEAKSGQYLHLAEALKWVYDGKGPVAGQSHNHTAAEWVLVVEDDFALCGQWGWDSIVRVMWELESGRIVVDGKEMLRRWGGFVATGGSGLIVHRSLLPLLSFILRAHAAIDSPLPAHMRRRPADLIIQDCLLGLDPLCPQPFSHHKSHSLTEKEAEDRGVDGSGGGPLIITSRLVMGHIGGAASTTEGKVYEPGKWRCGWRHPFHGREEVDVVVV